MQVLHDQIKFQIASAVSVALAKLEQEVAVEEVYALLSVPPNVKMGHFAYPCFSLAKVLRKAPPAIAAELEAALPELEAGLSSKIVGPYLNFFAGPERLGASVLEGILDGTYFDRELSADTPKTMIEYSQPNTHKVLHIGHLRNTVLGDALIRLYRYANYEVVSSTFPGDVGTHVAKCLWYMKTKNTEPAPETDRGAWLGNMYAAGNRLLKEETGTEKEAQNRAELTEVLKQLEREEGDYYDLWKETRQWSIEAFEEAYDWAGVGFDQWYWESEVDSDSVKLAREYLAKGIFIESQGTVGVDLSDEGLDYCMLLKSDGNGNYAVKDLELARRKFADYEVEKNIYVVDKRQEHHFKQVFACLKRMGFEHADKCYHLKYDFVSTSEGMLASREGNVVPVMDIVRKMEAHAKQEIVDHSTAEAWPEAELDRTGKIIAKGALKYGMLKYDPSKPIVFDLDEWMKWDGDSGPYLHYQFVRINSLCKRLASDLDAKVDWSVLKEDKEMEILLKLADFNQVAVNAAEQYRPNLMANYLFELCKLYSSFWSAHSVKDAETEALKKGRLAMSKAVSVILEKGLSLLGIPVPERM